MIRKIKAFLKAVTCTVKPYKHQILCYGIALGLACLNGIQRVVY